MSEPAIKVSAVSKYFVLPHQKAGTLKNLFTNIFRHRQYRSYEIQHALQDIDFEIKRGEFFGILGRNGSGKSTLLKMLAGIYQPTQGTVWVDGKLVPFIELGVGFNAELTGRENVYLNGALLGFSKEEMDAQYDDIVAFAELERFMDQKLKNYSSGMQVRLAFSLAIRAEADVLLVDEVLAVGDADFQRKCFDYFRSLKKSQKTVVFVTHDMSAVRQYCDRAMLIDQSKIVKIGSADEVAQLYTKLFLDGDSSEEEKKGKRWGDKKVMFESVTVTPKKLIDHGSITINCKVVAKKVAEDVVFGFSIKNAAGNQLLGTNTQIKKLKPYNMKPGETLQLEWEIPNIFSEGKHVIDCAVVYGGGTQIADWFEEAASFSSLNEEIVPYPVNPKINITVSNRGK